MRMCISVVVLSRKMIKEKKFFLNKKNESLNIIEIYEYYNPVFQNILIPIVIQRQAKMGQDFLPSQTTIRNLNHRAYATL